MIRRKQTHTAHQFNAHFGINNLKVSDSSLNNDANLIFSGQQAKDRLQKNKWERMLDKQEPKRSPRERNKGTRGKTFKMRLSQFANPLHRPFNSHKNVFKSGSGLKFDKTISQLSPTSKSLESHSLSYSLPSGEEVS